MKIEIDWNQTDRLENRPPWYVSAERKLPEYEPQEPIGLLWLGLCFLTLAAGGIVFLAWVLAHSL